jgi:hypothetical protein
VSAGLAACSGWPASGRCATASTARIRSAPGGAFADGTHETLRHDPAAAAVPRCLAVRLPEPSFEPPFGDFRPFWS